VGLGLMMGPPTVVRSMEGLGGCQALIKWKISVLLCSMTRLVLIRIFDIML